MNRTEAKTILLLYRTPADAADPQMAEALALVEQDAELARWFSEYRATQQLLREKFREIAVPAGLREQIISEQNAVRKNAARRDRWVMAGAVAAIVVALAVFSLFLLPRGPKPLAANSILVFRGQMIDFAAGNYAMDLATNDPAQIKAFLAQHGAPADYALPPSLAQATSAGCAVKDWNGAKVTMICFLTGKPLSPGAGGDLWLFVIDRRAVKDVPAGDTPQVNQLDHIVTASWTQGDKLYLLGTPGTEPDIRKYL